MATGRGPITSRFNVRGLLKTLSAGAAVAAATAAGGPIVGAEVAAFLATPAGQKLLDLNIDSAASRQGVVLEDLAHGGLVTQPTFGFTGEAGPEMVIPIAAPFTMQPKRKPSAYNRKYAAAYRRIKKKKTLKSGKMAKGFAGKAGHQKIVKLAHAEVKKARRKKK